MKKQHPVFASICLLGKVSMSIILSIFAINNLHAQVIFSEISGDSGNNDGTNDGIVELINIGNTNFDAGCYVISNAEWVVVLPPGTMIAPGATFLIACSTGQNVGLNPNPIPGSGLTCATCDFPNMPIDFDVCDPANAGFIDWAATGFTIDNQADNDGDQVVLFEPDGTIVQAVKWGGGATSAFDNTAVQSGAYTLGTPGSGGAGLSSAQLPAALQMAGSCFQMGINYTMPIITDAVYEDLTNASNPGGKAINATILQGCNSSFIFDVNTNTWSKTDHPNPGQPNDSPAYQVSFSAPLVQCAGNTQAIEVTLEVFNWQAVTPGITNAKGGVGSFVSFDNGATQIPWTTYNRDNTSGITTLAYSFTPNTNEMLSVVWDDDKSSELASTPTGSASPTAVVQNTTPSDCYEVEQYQIFVVEPLLISNTNISCPEDFSAGNVNIGSLTSGGLNVTYELFDNGLSQSSNNSGIFNISNMFSGPVTIEVTDAAGCFDPIVVNIDNNCQQAPTCPTSLAYDDCTTTPSNLCPGEEINLSIDAATATGLPDGGLIEWVRVAAASDDPYTSGLEVLATQTISLTGSAPSGGPVINEILVDAAIESGTAFGEGWEIAGTPGTNIGCAYFTDGDFVVQIPAGTVIPTDGFYVIGSDNSDAAWSSNIDLLLTSTSTIPNLTNGGEFLAFFDASNTFLQGVSWGNSMTASNIPATTGEPTVSVAGTGCTTVLPSFSSIQSAVQMNAASFVNAGIANGTNERSIELDVDVAGTWQQSAAPGSSSNTMGNSNSGADALMTMLTPACAAYTIPADACNSTIYVRPRVVPVDETCGNSTLPAQSFDISCPTAMLTGDGTACPSNTVSLAVEFANYIGTPTFTIDYAINGLPQTPIITTDDPYTLNASTPGEYVLTDVTLDGGNCTALTSGVAIVEINETPDILLNGTFDEVCVDAYANISLTINSGTLPMLVTYDIDGGTSQSVEIFNETLFIPTTGLSPNTNYTINITAVEDANGCNGMANGSATLNTIDCDFICPTITTITSPDGACANANFDLEATDLSNMSIALNGEADFGIHFVYFVGNTPPTEPYVGGTSLGTISNNNLLGTSPNQSALLENINIGTPGTYQICALLDAEPTLDAACRPAACKTIRIVEPPVLTATPTAIDLCVNAINQEDADLSIADVQFDLEAIPNVELETGETLRYRIRNIGLGTSINDPNMPSANVTAMPAADANGLTTILNPGDNQSVNINDNIIIGNPEHLLQPVTMTYTIFPRHRFPDGSVCDGEDITVTATIHPAPVVEAGTVPNAICSTRKLDLSTLNASITNSGQPYTGTWSIKETDSDGQFLDSNMQPLVNANYSQTTFFMPSPADAERGFVTLILTSDDPDGSCGSVADEVVIRILKVDCGNFPWKGNN